VGEILVSLLTFISALRRSEMFIAPHIPSVSGSVRSRMFVGRKNQVC
jgi:hypothetical protein